MVNGNDRVLQKLTDVTGTVVESFRAGGGTGLTVGAATVAVPFFAVARFAFSGRVVGSFPNFDGGKGPCEETCLR